LDLTLIKNNNGNILTKWYEKEIKRGKILNYYSQHPIKQKENTVENLILRCLKLTDKIYLPKVKKQVENILKLNCYSDSFFKKTWNKMYYIYKNNVTKKDNKINSENDDPTNSNNKKIYASLTFVEGLSQQIKNTLKICEEKPTIYSLKPSNKIKKLAHTQLADKIEKSEQSGVVYQVNCNNCDGVYIGETRQKLHTRMDQHAYDIKSNKDNTALANHVKNLKHTVNLEQPKILDTEHNHQKRKFLEALHISKNSKSINYKEDSKEINKFYYNILEKIN